MRTLMITTMTEHYVIDKNKLNNFRMSSSGIEREEKKRNRPTSMHKKALEFMSLHRYSSSSASSFPLADNAIDDKQ